MSDSNARILRKKYARMIVDEIFTINTELEQLSVRLKNTDYRSLKVLDYDQLKNIRGSLQNIHSNIRSTDDMIDRFLQARGEKYSNRIVLSPQEGEEQEILIDEFRYRQDEQARQAAESASSEKQVKTIHIRATSERVRKDDDKQPVGVPHQLLWVQAVRPRQSSQTRPVWRKSPHHVRIVKTEISTSRVILWKTLISIMLIFWRTLRRKSGNHPRGVFPVKKETVITPFKIK